MLSESAVINLVKLEASRKGLRLWRNNVGAMHDPQSGTFVRFGLANESPAMNKQIKSGDLIGIRPVTPVCEVCGYEGKPIGQFVSREVKNSAWTYRGTEREQAQFNWMNLINAMGGDAAFATSEGTL